MKAVKIWTIFLLVFNFLCASAQDAYYFPQVFFNKKVADSMLTKGTSTIEGIAYTRAKANSSILWKQKQYAGSGVVITLIPCTEYFNTWYNLKKQYNSNSTSIFMSAEAFSYHLETTTDSYSRFKFENMRPGKYYLEAVIPYTTKVNYKQQTGSTDYFNGYGGYMGSSPTYGSFFYYSQNTNRESTFVEITREGQLAEVKLH
jgi:hypothetical protein